jgi:hypothetical protein
LEKSEKPLKRVARFHPSSEIELAESIDFLNNEADELGFKLSDEVETVIRRILRNPELYAQSDFDISVRGASLNVFHYTIFYIYEKESESIYILSIAPHRKEPGYWAERMKEIIFD